MEEISRIYSIPPEYHGREKLIKALSENGYEYDAMGEAIYFKDMVIADTEHFNHEDGTIFINMKREEGKNLADFLSQLEL